MNGKQFLLVGALLAGAIVSGWLMQGGSVHTEMPTVSASGPDLFVDAMDLKIIGDDGGVHYRVQASRMEHFPHDKHSELTDPFLQVLGEGRTLWDVHSERGRVADQADTVWLLGRAVLNRPPDATHRALNVVTRDVVVKPPLDTAETAAQAVLTSGSYRMEGVGMLTNFRESRLDLRSRVRGKADAGG